MSQFPIGPIPGPLVVEGDIQATGAVEATGFLGDGGVMNFSTLRFVETAAPENPAVGGATVWLSNGTGAGNQGNLMMLVNVGGAVKTITLGWMDVS